MGEGPATVGARRTRKGRLRYYAAMAAATVTGSRPGRRRHGGRRERGAARRQFRDRSGAAACISRRRPRRPSSTWWSSSTRMSRSTTTSGPTRTRPTPTAAPSRQARHPEVNGLYTSITSNGPTGPLLTSNPNPTTPPAVHSAGPDLRPGPRLHAGAAGLQRREDGQVRPVHRDRHLLRRRHYGAPGLVMDYYDGNTVTGLWNYAQNYAMSDNNYDTDFGPSTPGALNLISGQTAAATPSTRNRRRWRRPGHGERAEQRGPGHHLRRPGPGLRRLLGHQPHQRRNQPLGVATGQNIGDLLNAKTSPGAGSRAGSRRPAPTRRGLPVCGASTPNIGGTSVDRLLAAPRAVPVLRVHGQPRAPAAELGGRDRAHRPGQPPVRPVRLLHDAEGRQHAGGQLPEGRRSTRTATPATPTRWTSRRSWSTRSTRSSSPSTGASTAIVITYDDSDGWYDHQPPAIVNGSNTSADDRDLLLGAVTLGSFPDRCGYGPRLPLLVISPWTRQNYVSTS